jgi:hypothetical protein
MEEEYSSDQKIRMGMGHILHHETKSNKVSSIQFSHNIPNLKCIYRTPMAFGLGFKESTSIVFFVLAFSES